MIKHAVSIYVNCRENTYLSLDPNESTRNRCFPTFISEEGNIQFQNSVFIVLYFYNKDERPNSEDKCSQISSRMTLSAKYVHE
jgi:hypothetical protein